MLERGALVLGESLLCDENRNEFGFTQFHHGETFNRLGELIPFTFTVISDGEVQPIPHEVDVSLDRLGGDLDVTRQACPVRTITRFDGTENLVHPIQWRSR